MKIQLFSSLLQLAYAHSDLTTGSGAPTNDTTAMCAPEAVHQLRPTPLPVCSLTPEKSSLIDEPPELLSFEEWKQVQVQRAITSTPANPGTPEPAPKDAEDIHHKTAALEDSNSNSQQPLTSVFLDENSSLTPSIRVPLTDRFNYASQDCTARIHSAHRSAQHSSTVLSSKKDRYMLSPCTERQKYVVVELCDDVRVDTVQIANYEFFSAVFKDIKISLSENTPSMDPKKWVDGGTWRAKNNRGVQSFHPTNGRNAFYRYIRIDFLSHYGSEHFCPISLVRVYGLTHMEDYKWAGWQIDEQEEKLPTPIEPVHDQKAIKADESTPPADIKVLNESQTASDPVPVIPDAALATSTTSSSARPTASGSVATSTTESLVTLQTIPLPPATVKAPIAVDEASEPSAPPISAAASSSAPDLDSISSDAVLESGSTDVQVPQLSSAPSSSASSVKSATPAPSPSASIPAPPPPHSSTAASENIYRTIMNRLQILETNSTLGIKYVEEQTRSVRQVVQKLEEDVGRLQGLGNKQQRMLERVVVDIDLHRRTADEELRKLASDVQALAREVTLEKRLGFLQLCLLIVLFIFMALTRGSRGENTRTAAGIPSLGSWQSGDWSMSRWRTNRHRAAESSSGMPSPTSPTSPTITNYHDQETMTTSPTKRSAPSSSPPLIHVNLQSPPQTGDPSAETEDPFLFMPNPSIAGPSNPKTSPALQFRSPLSFSPSRGKGLSRPQSAGGVLGRPRVTSTPSFPAKYQRSAGAAKKTSHLHEVQMPPHSKRRAGSKSRDGIENGNDETPRKRGSGFLRRSPATAVNSTLKLPQEEEAEEQKQFEREFSPASTAAEPEVQSADESGGAWEDTSTDGENDAEGRVFCETPSETEVSHSPDTVRVQA